MRIVGPALFSDGDVGKVLSSQLGRVAPDAVFNACSGTGRVSKLALTRAVVAAASFCREIALGEPAPILCQTVTDYGNVEASCAIAFTGEATLWRLGTPASVNLRLVRGTVTGGTLVLKAEAGREFVPWLPTLFEAEIMMVEQHLAAQAEAVARYHGMLGKRAKALVDRIHPALDIAYYRENNRQYAGMPPVQDLLRRQVWEKALRSTAKSSER